MKEFDEEIKALIAEYLTAEISEKNLKKLEQIADEKKVPLADLVEMYQQIDRLVVPGHSRQMDDNFYAMLHKEKAIINRKINNWSKLWDQVVQIITVPQVPRLAYGFMLLLTGLLTGNMILPNKGYEQQITAMSAEMSEMRKLMVLSMLEDDQAIDRIKAVGYVDEMNEVDSKVIDALFETLNNDENINVRLVSLETLLRFTHLAVVRKGLIKSFEKQESPIVILELAEVLIQLQDKKSIEKLKNLLKKEDLDPNLRMTIESGIKRIS